MSDHPHRLQRDYDDRFVQDYDPQCPVLGQVAEQFRAGDVLENGVARIRYDACTNVYLLAADRVERLAAGARASAQQHDRVPVPVPRRLSQ